MPRQALTTKYGQPATRANRLAESIQVGRIVGRVQRCALGEVEMTSTELQAAKLLINKVIPDIQPDKDAGRQVKDISHADPHSLLTIIEGKAERTG